jgi:hypothetical protein
VTGIDYVGTFSSATTFSLTTFNLNPRITAVFPRLSGIATVWRRYFFRKLRFHLFGINAATQSGYTAMSSLVTDDLATLVTPSSESQVLNMENLAIGRPWSYVVHTVNLGGLGLEWYTTDTTASSSEFGEAIGRAFLALPATTSVADIRVQIYVEYDIEFCQRISSDLVAACDPISGGRIVGSGVSTSNILGTSATVDSQSVGISVNSSGVITISSAGTYLLTCAGSTGSPPSSLAYNLGMGITSLGSFVTYGSSNFTGYLAFTCTPGSTIGPISISASSISSGIVQIASAPSNSLSYSEPCQYESFPRLRVDAPKFTQY